MVEGVPNENLPELPVEVSFALLFEFSFGALNEKVKPLLVLLLLSTLFLMDLSSFLSPLSFS